MADHFTPQHFNCYERKQYLNDTHVKIPKRTQSRINAKRRKLEIEFLSKQTSVQQNQTTVQTTINTLNRIISQTKTKLTVN